MIEQPRTSRQIRSDQVKTKKDKAINKATVQLVNAKDQASQTCRLIQELHSRLSKRSAGERTTDCANQNERKKPTARPNPPKATGLRQTRQYLTSPAPIAAPVFKGFRPFRPRGCDSRHMKGWIADAIVCAVRAWHDRECDGYWGIAAWSRVSAGGSLSVGPSAGL